ncbi:MAG: hypothetical protein IKG15_03465 [Solobacterium sp.]|nr:hypothetical protein [Solobacterium sp.]
MKKTGIALLCVTVLAVMTAGCTGKQASEQKEENNGQLSAPGGWTVNSEANVNLTEKETAVFEQATETLTGVGYTPVAVVAEQVVSGTNRAYLCTGTVVTPDAEPEWYILTIYEPFEGSPEIIGNIKMDINNIYTLENVNTQEAVGSWEVKKADPVRLPENAQNAFDKAAEGYTGVGFYPVALLGTQVVSGTNYRILCRGEMVTSDPVVSLYVIDVYEDPEHNAQITDVKIVFLEMYAGINL